MKKSENWRFQVDCKFCCGFFFCIYLGLCIGDRAKRQDENFKATTRLCKQINCKDLGFKKNVKKRTKRRNLMNREKQLIWKKLSQVFIYNYIIILTIWLKSKTVKFQTILCWNSKIFGTSCFCVNQTKMVYLVRSNTTSSNIS